MQDYDSIPYESVPFPETHPQRLALLGRMFGLDTAPPERCRVLELGGASGGNLIPMAWGLPQSEFVGLDLSGEQVRVGQGTIQRLGLNNIQLHQADLCQFDDRAGSYDYIIAHGVYSWVPAPVRDALLALIQRLLAPNGIAYVSYNTQPGWAVRGILRSMALYHTREISEPPARLQAMLELFDFLRGYYATSKNPLQQQLHAELKAIADSHPSYLYHEFLEAENTAVLFSEFTRHIEPYGLKYLCESELHTMFASTLPAAGGQFLDRYDDMLVQEQYIDYLRQRTFRMSLLVHAGRQPRYDIDLTALDHYAVHSSLIPPAKLHPERNKPAVFGKPGGGEVEVSQPHTQLALQRLHEQAPAALRADELFRSAEQHLHTTAYKSTATALDAYSSELFNLFVNGMVELVLTPRHPPPTDQPRLVLTPLAQAEAAVGNVLSGAWHEPVHLDGFAHLLVEGLDGERDMQAIINTMLETLRSRPDLAGALHIDTATDEGRLRLAIRKNVERLLGVFARQGVIEY